MYSQSNGGAIVIAVCGKGGVGKTSLSATMVKILVSNPGNRVLAIDADPSVGLASALGITVHKTVDDIRNELIARVTNGEAGVEAALSAFDARLEIGSFWDNTNQQQNSSTNFFSQGALQQDSWRNFIQFSKRGATGTEFYARTNANYLQNNNTFANLSDMKKVMT